MSISYAGKTFRSVSNSAGGDVGSQTTFDYHQEGDVVWATYSGGAVRFGTLIALADPEGHLEMRYHHIASDGSIKTGRCRSRAELLPDGRLRLHEAWQWTDGTEGRGTSIVEELVPPQLNHQTRRSS